MSPVAEIEVVHVESKFNVGLDIRDCRRYKKGYLTGVTV